MWTEKHDHGKYHMSASASVYIRYEGNLESLSNLLSEELSLPKFWFKSDQDYPHEERAMCEVLGFEMWLNEVPNIPNYSFEFEMETMVLPNQDSNTEKSDLSPWLVRCLSVICGIESCVKSKYDI